MKRFVLGAMGAAIVSISAPAAAADWWLVAGDAQDDRMTFVDAGSLQDKAGAVTLRTVSIDRTGNVATATQKVDCKSGSGSADAEVAKFVCSTEGERRKTFAMLGSLNPLEAANAIFRSSGPAMNASGPRPQARPMGDVPQPTEA